MDDKEKYRAYEREKKKLKALLLKPKEYQKRIKELSARLKI